MSKGDITLKGVEHRLVGRRRLPCGHHGIRLSDDDAHGFDRTCDTCHKTFSGEILPSEMLTEKLGRPTATIRWDNDPYTTQVDDIRNPPIRKITKRVGNGGRSAPQTPLTSQPRSKVTRVGPPQ